MLYLYPNGDTFTIYSEKQYLSEKYHTNLIEIESLPEGVGILRQAGDGSFYYEPYPPIEPIGPEPEPTLDEKIDNLEQVVKNDNMTTFDALATMYEDMSTSTVTQFDVMATMYEEIIALREEVALLKGGSN